MKGMLKAKVVFVCVVRSPVGMFFTSIFYSKPSIAVIAVLCIIKKKSFSLTSQLNLVRYRKITECHITMMRCLTRTKTAIKDKTRQDKKK